MGAYHSTENFEIFETGKNCTEIPREKFQKIPEIPGWKSNGREISRKNVSKICVYLTRLSSFPEFMQITNFLLSAS